MHKLKKFAAAALVVLAFAFPAARADVGPGETLHRYVTPNTPVTTNAWQAVSNEVATVSTNLTAAIESATNEVLQTARLEISATAQSATNHTDSATNALHKSFAPTISNTVTKAYVEDLGITSDPGNYAAVSNAAMNARSVTDLAVYTNAVEDAWLLVTNGVEVGWMEGDITSGWNIDAVTLLYESNVVWYFYDDTEYNFSGPSTVTSLTFVTQSGSVTNVLTRTITTNAVATSDTLALASDLASYVPTSRTVNGHALSTDITLSASDIGAYSYSDGTNLADAVSAKRDYDDRSWPVPGKSLWYFTPTNSTSPVALYPVDGRDGSYSDTGTWDTAARVYLSRNGTTWQIIYPSPSGDASVRGRATSDLDSPTDLVFLSNADNLTVVGTASFGYTVTSLATLYEVKESISDATNGFFRIDGLTNDWLYGYLTSTATLGFKSNAVPVRFMLPDAGEAETNEAGVAEIPLASTNYVGNYSTNYLPLSTGSGKTVVGAVTFASVVGPGPATVAMLKVGGSNTAYAVEFYGSHAVGWHNKTTELDFFDGVIHASANGTDGAMTTNWIVRPSLGLHTRSGTWLFDDKDPSDDTTSPTSNTVARLSDLAPKRDYDDLSFDGAAARYPVTVTLPDGTAVDLKSNTGDFPYSPSGESTESDDDYVLYIYRNRQLRFNTPYIEGDDTSGDLAYGPANDLSATTLTGDNGDYTLTWHTNQVVATRLATDADLAFCVQSSALAGKTFDFSSPAGLYAAVSNIVTALGGSVTNYPSSFPTGD